uniref:Transmembrane protein 186 n=1 Tax=Podarcis muralis TaxID=64176 RepID=A0A670JW23_PODMU|nr:transmembrane protein 186 [Podarcis muralis]
MARILTACVDLPFLAPCGRCLRNQVPLRWQKGFPASTRPFGVLTALKPCSQQAPGSQPARPRWLGTLAPSQHALEQRPDLESTHQYKLIYRFPWIKYCRILSRLKLLQTGLTILVLPPIWVLYWQNQVPLVQCLYCTGLACFAAAMLYGMSFFLRRIIGMMYLSEDGTLLKVAHLTFWGRRRDIYCPVATVMTLGDVGEDPNELLLPLRRYDRDNVLYFSLRYGQVVDKEAFAKVFEGLG